MREYERAFRRAAAHYGGFAYRVKFLVTTQALTNS